MFGNTYNPSWRNHPNLSWSNNNNNQWRLQAPLGFGGTNVQQHQNQSQFKQDEGSSSSSSSLESKMEKFIDLITTKMNQ